MQPGILYGFGALGDVALMQGYDFPITAYSSDGITASTNQNATGFSSPSYAYLAGAAEIPLNLYTGSTATAAPLPSTAYAGLGLLGGLGVMVLARRRKVIAD